VVHVGLTSTVKGKFSEEISRLDQDGFLIRGMGDDLMLAGPSPWATGFAVYSFLEDHCGVRWVPTG